MPDAREDGKERIAVYRVRRSGEAMRWVIFEGEGNSEERVAHCASPNGVRDGSGRVWFASERLWKPWAWRTK